MQAEVEYIDKTSKAIDVAFRVDDFLDTVKDLFNSDEPDEISFIIWTTTPWTIPSNVAVCINPKYKYSLIKMNEKFYVLAFDRTMHQTMEAKIDLISTINGEKLIDINLIHPFDRKSVLLHADHVTTEAGNSVHIALAHGMDDYLICKKNNIDTIHSLNNKAFFKDELDFIAGLPALKADPLIIEKLQEHNALVNIEDYHHSYPHCWRRKTPLIFTSTPQWFISRKIILLMKPLIKLIMLIGSPHGAFKELNPCLPIDQIGVFQDKETGESLCSLVVHKDWEIHPNQKDLFEKFALAIEKQGISAWDKLDLKDYIQDYDEYVKTSDSLDVWFDSGITHYAVSSKDLVKILSQIFI